MSSTSLYDTFGNNVESKVNQDTLGYFLENSTIKFSLPEASAEILADLVDVSSINPTELEAVQSKLERIGFGIANARAMASIIIRVSKDQGVSPMSYFDNNAQTLQFTIDTYNTINMLRPPGSQIGVTAPINNKRSRVRKLIQP